jgi:hypothetical protein
VAALRRSFPSVSPRAPVCLAVPAALALHANRVLVTIVDRAMRPSASNRSYCAGQPNEVDWAWPRSLVGDEVLSLTDDLAHLGVKWMTR